jgi:hypothetical protein
MSMVTVHDDVIRSAMQEAVEKIKAGIDLEKAKMICKQELGVASLNDLDIKEAHTSVYDGQPALRLKFRFTGDFDMVVDFQGNCLSVFQEDQSSPQDHAAQRIEEASSQAAKVYQQF